MKKNIYTLILFLMPFTYNYSQVYVNQNATGSNDGSSWENAYTDLQSALSLSSPSEIWIGEGEYKPSLLDSAIYFKLEAGHSLYGSLPIGATSLSEANLEINATVLNGDINGDDDPSDNFINKADNALHLLYIPEDLGDVTVSNLSFKNGATLLTNDNDESNFQQRGGGIYALGNISVLNCKFENNIARSGGGIYILSADSGLISNCTFDNNYVFSQAGGLMLAVCSGLEVSDCLFSNNAVNRGALYTFESTDCSILNCTFFNNMTNEGEFGSGGYFNWQSLDIDMKDCRFEGNTSSSAGAVYLDGRNVESGNQLTLDGCTFINNSAENFGGGFYVFEGEAIVKNSSFDGNTGGNAGAMYLDSSKVSISETFFVNNSSEDFGGAIYTFEGVYDLDGITFSNNSAVNGAGAYFAVSDCEISNSTWSNNFANESPDDTTPFGAGLYMSRCDYTINSSTFDGNISSYSAGAIFNTNSTFEINETMFTSNLGTFGGAVTNYNSGTNGSYNDCSFLSNRANTSGGASTVGFLGSVDFNNCSFLLNSADFGGALYMQNDSSYLRVNASSFIENSSVNSGGAISTGGSNYLEVSNSIFNENQSNSGGAIRYNADTLRTGFLMVDKSIFDDNRAFNQGGALDISNAAIAEVKSCLIHSNNADNGAGGGIISNAFNGLNSDVRLINNTIVNNGSSIGAGVAHFQEDGSNGKITFQNTILIHFSGLDYEVEDGEPTAVSLGGNLTAYPTLATIFNATNDDIQVSPSFVNENASDYRLEDGSALIDQGVTNGGHITDLDGLPIVGEVDKGCYENQMSVSTQELLDVQGIKVLNNPATDKINFEIDNSYSGGFKVSIINAQGQVMTTNTFEKHSGYNTFSINIDEFSPGTYFVVYKIGSGVTASKVVIE